MNIGCSQPGDARVGLGTATGSTSAPEDVACQCLRYFPRLRDLNALHVSREPTFATERDREATLARRVPLSHLDEVLRAITSTRDGGPSGAPVAEDDLALDILKACLQGNF